MTSPLSMRWSTDLVTFFEPTRWGLPAEIPYGRWESEFNQDPKRFFESMLDDAVTAGLDGIELAPAPGGWENALRAYGTAEAFGEAVTSRGLLVSGSYMLPVWLADILAAPDDDTAFDARVRARDLWARHTAFARAVGCDTVITSTIPRAAFSDIDGVDAPVDSFERPAAEELIDRVAELLNEVGAISGREGARLAIHTDAYSVCSRTIDVDRLMERTDPESVFLCVDAGHIALDGGDPVEVLSKHARRSPILHVKDCAAPLPPHTLSGPPMTRHDEMVKWFRLAGTGIVRWDALTRTLGMAAWSGWGVSEVDMSANPIGDIRAGSTFLQNQLAKTGA